MGSRKLKKKEELNYRKAKQRDFGRCQYCRFRRYHNARGLSGEDLGKRRQCLVMGLGNCRKHGINPLYTCDAYEGDRSPNPSPIPTPPES